MSKTSPRRREERRQGDGKVIAAQVYAEHPNLALTPTIRNVSDVDITVVSDASTDPHNDVYFFRVETTDFDRFEASLSEDHTVETFSLLLGENGVRTYRVEYTPEAELLSPPMEDVGGLTMDAHSHLNGWVLELQLQDHDGLYALDAYANERDIHLDVLELQHIDGYDHDTDFGLTGPQREALLAAFDNGYYDEPRETSLEELAALLGISPTAVSGRLRRGSRQLIETLLVDAQE